MIRGRLLLRLMLASFIFSLATVAPEAAAQGWSSWFGAGNAAPGSPDWWKANKKKAEFVPGEGYRVEGVEGYFDGLGRPISASADELVAQFPDDEQKEVGIFPELDPKRSFRRMKSVVGYGPDQQEAQQALAAGEQLFQQREYAKASKLLKRAVDRWPDSAAGDRAQFLLGESYFFQDKYVEARDTYDELVSRQPNTRELNTLIERQWAIARYWEKYYFEYKKEAPLRPNWFDKTRPTLDTIGQAIKTYESIRLNDPTGPRAEDAIMATAGIYFRRGHFEDADHQYSLLRTEYPRSEHQFDAHLLGLQCKLQKYQGPDYDGSALEEGEALLKQIRTQFRGRLTEEEKDRLKLVQAKLQQSVEERDLRMAQYYDNTEHYGAARQYYHRIAVEHRGSPIAQQAEARLAQLGGAPDMPEERLSWFVDLFPENRERTRIAQIPELPATSGTRLAENPEAGGGVQPASATSTR